MILRNLLRRKLRLIEQFARPLPPMLAALFEDAGTGALVVNRDGRIVRTNRRLDAMLAAGGASAPGGGMLAAAGGAVAAGTGTPGPAGGAVAGRSGTPAEACGAHCDWTGPAPDAPIEALFAPADRSRVATALAAALGGAPVTSLQVRLHGGTPTAAPVVALSIAPLRESDGEISGLLLRLTDVSAEKLMEAELAQLQKLQAVGQLAGGIAHDFNNLLMAIIAATDAVLERDGGAPETLDDARQIRQSADRGAALVRQLLAFGRRQPLRPAVVAVNTAVTNVSDLLVRLLGEGIRLQLELEDPGRSVRVDPTQLDQVLINLAVNARDAMPDGGTLTLRTGHLTLYQPRQVGSETMPPGRYVTIRVEDTGEGIAPTALPQVFEPFFTTRRERGGSGLGLSTVHGIVRQSGGFVTVDSVVGEGTCVRFWLPRHEETEVVSGFTADGVVDGRGATIGGLRIGSRLTVVPQTRVLQAEVPEAGTPEASAPRPGAPEAGAPEASVPKASPPFAATPDKAAAPSTEKRTPSAVARFVLLVEDEASVRRLTERALQRAGWQVSAVDSAEAALAQMPRPGDPAAPPCVLVSDIVLPGMDGTELARTVRAVWPDLPVVLVSGYTDSALLGDLTAQGVSFLAKPFGLRELVACVERAAA